MSSAELSQYLEIEAQENPFIEIESVAESDIIHEKGSEDLDTSNYWQEENYLRYEVANSNFGVTDGNIRPQCISLREHILEQSNISFANERDKFIANYLTDLLDYNGYLRESIEETANNLNCSTQSIEIVLNKLKTFDPIGVFAKNINECLEIQLREQGVEDQKIYDIVDNLDAIASGKFEKLLKKLDIDQNAFVKYMSIIRTLDPKPARNFDYEVTRTRIADAYIYKDQAGNFAVKLNSNALSSICINSKYFDKVYQHAKTADEKKFCSGKLQIANWLMRSVAQRADTILRVVTKLAEIQYEFLSSGLAYLKPMTLAGMAKMLDLHESTISRISNKYVSTPFGLFEIKYFFSNSLASNISENFISTRVVKSKIKTLVDEEERNKNVMSDDDIARHLSENGINISRRTVAKYRDMLKIDPSHVRKRKASSRILL